MCWRDKTFIDAPLWRMCWRMELCCMLRAANPCKPSPLFFSFPPFLFVGFMMVFFCPNVTVALFPSFPRLWISFLFLLSWSPVSGGAVVSTTDVAFRSVPGSGGQSTALRQDSRRARVPRRCDISRCFHRRAGQIVLDCSCDWTVRRFMHCCCFLCIREHRSGCASTRMSEPTIPGGFDLFSPNPLVRDERR